MWRHADAVFPIGGLPAADSCRSMHYAHSSRTTGPEVSAIGLGAMGMSDLYGPTDEGESIATIHAAIDAGVT